MNGDNIWKYALVAISITLVLCAGCITTNNIRPNKILNPTDINVWFLDVGHGDCIIIQSANITILVDTGFPTVKDVVMKKLNELSDGDIEYFFVTHSHADHDGLVYDIFKKFPVHHYYTNQNVTRGDKYIAGDITMRVLHPRHGVRFKNENDNSIVLHVSRGNFDMLLTGDIEKPAENDLIRSGLFINVDVMKVAHHGSDSSTSKAFLNVVNPDISIISCGTLYSGADTVVVDRLQDFGNTVYITAREGDVRVSSNCVDEIRVFTSKTGKEDVFRDLGDICLK